MNPPLPEFSHPAGIDLWVFAYGSLMWNPGFAFVEQREGLLRGYHRAFCIYSHQHRGTPERPGAVLGLDRGGSCRGRAYRVAADMVPGVLEYLWQREMTYRVYIPRRLRVATPAGDVYALTFTADPAHAQYCGRLGLDGTAALIRQGVGQSGRNVDYLASLIEHLSDLGIHDRGLQELAARVG